MTDRMVRASERGAHPVRLRPDAIESVVSDKEHARSIDAEAFAGPRVRRVVGLEVDDYHKLGEAGILHEDDRVELVEGMLIDLAPVGTGHAGQVNRLVNRLAPAVSGRAIVAPRNPLRLDEFSEPQPDVLLLRYRDDFCATAHPRPSDVLLLIEVADTSRAYDRDTKIPLYARYAIPEVWLIDVHDRRMKTFLEPATDGYRRILRPTATDRISPVLFPDVSVDVADLLDLRSQDEIQGMTERR